MSKIIAALVGVLALAAGTQADYVLDDLCLSNECSGTGSERVCIFRFQLDIFVSETGYFLVEGCEDKGHMPTLGMEANVKYIFDQSNKTNWFHPLGFAYAPDGALSGNDELEKGVDPPGGTTCNETLSCQYPQYKLNGEILCDEYDELTGLCADEEDFGLDQYEGVWFSGGRDNWIDAGNFTIEVNITDDATKEIFAFCHIHKYMSFRIKILDTETLAIRAPTDEIALGYEYHEVEGFDAGCGTFNVSQYQGHEQCGDHVFHCNGDANTFNECMAAINCKMMTEMRTSGNSDPTAEFMYQMIPHHQNAVNMAKMLLHFNPGSLKCGTSYDGRRLSELEGPELALYQLAAANGRRLDESFCNDDNDEGGTPAVTMLWEIVNGQNAQITFMRSWLEDNLVPAYDWCEAEDDNSTLVAVLAGCLAAAVVAPVAGYLVYRYKFRKPTATVSAVKTISP
ncbi:Hypothetical Protein FCC1311_092362 [Hondaea fermentalgiana]|uniref:Uncharacterized protein n=1 Tax=Hondaea fermentalgiana TaxID=2315210 RepID=A0A2R5GQ54_9STRA|nr:Hypothetical Protein FCC1311_092362 [Hondaea fermentalgiana]|eukprot:GBG33012.1 Hypothetical Protein FCC1311_092362 [Hondaea fermentalgiana]